MNPPGAHDSDAIIRVPGANVNEKGCAAFSLPVMQAGRIPDINRGLLVHWNMFQGK